MESLKQKCSALAHRIKHIKFNEESKQQNKLFETNPKLYFSKIRNEKVQQAKINDKEAVAFWEKIWAAPVKFDTKAVWLPAIETHFSKVHEQKIEQFTVQEVSVAIRKTHNFKAPGLDGIQNIILKKLTNLHPSLCYCSNALIKETSVPSWLLQAELL